MIIEWDVPIEMSDGLLLRADVFRPDGEGRYPVVLGASPYAKGLPFPVGYPDQWRALSGSYPEVTASSSGRYQVWEFADPERWVPDGYALVRIDIRGSGRSPGYLDPYSAREIRDLYESIEWAGVQPWSSGKVGMTGISYVAANEWLVAGLQPPHLTAMIPWEGAADWYRDRNYHGGIMCINQPNWYEMQVLGVQHGMGDRSPVNPHTGEHVAGPETLDDATRAANRVDLAMVVISHPFDDAYRRERSADWSKVRVPFLSAGNWGGQGLHLRGNIEAFTQAASEEKWLEVHGEEHWTHFYTDYGLGLQRRFFDHYLKGIDNGWEKTPPVLLQVRGVDGFTPRSESEWPLARTRWTSLALDAAGCTLSADPPAQGASASYDPAGDGLTFSLPVFEAETEITGPLAARLFISSATRDADIFAVLRAFAPDGEEVVFNGANDPHMALAYGWLRASQRALDPARSRPERPFHPHDRAEPLTPGQVYELEVEIWPTSIVLPAGYRLALTIRGRDYVYPPLAGAAEQPRVSTFRRPLTGVGPFLHDDPRDRPPEVFGGTVTIWTGPDHPSALLVPVIPG